MRVISIAVIAMAMSTMPNVISQEHALFVKRDSLDAGKRVTRQTSADQMVQNILQWLQGVYAQNSRKIRQGSFREYLPPSNTQKPRPFEPPSGENGDDNYIGYPPSGIKPQPPFPSPGSPGYQEPRPFPPKTTAYPETSTGYTDSGNKPTPGFPGYPGGGNGYPGGNDNGYPGGNNGYPTPTPYPGTTTGYPGNNNGNGYPTPTQYPGSTTGGYPGPSTGYPGPTTPYPTYPTTGRPERPEQTPSPEYPSTEYPSNGYTTRPTGPPSTYPTQPSKYPTYPPATNPPQTFPPPTATYPSQTEEPVYPPGQIVQTDQPATDQPEASTSKPYTSKPSYTTAYPTEKPQTEKVEIITPTGKPGDSESNGSDSEEDLKHPPHIHEINVECAKDMMTINIEFNRPFNGIIYSKGYYSNPDCRYVQENSGEIKYSFTVSLNSCGTEFINAFDTEGQSYLENVLVLQNEAGIQEVWDTIRSVRCLWEGNLNKALSVALSVGMLTQEIVTFSGDTAMARLDIQMGKGPFAPAANGLVKIGETMTLVVSVTGDPGFDIHVRDCRAKDNSGENSVALTDDNGCVLKPKLMGAFQKTRDTGNTGASIIAYSYFNAFKFPDIMDLMIECNVELCKSDCDVCPDPDQKIDPGRRRRRDLYRFNESLGDPVTLGKALRVILPEDLSSGEVIVNLNTKDEICVSTGHFVISSGALISLLTTSMFFSAYLWLKNQRLALLKA